MFNWLQKFCRARCLFCSSLCHCFFLTDLFFRPTSEFIVCPVVSLVSVIFSLFRCTAMCMAVWKVFIEYAIIYYVWCWKWFVYFMYTQNNKQQQENPLVCRSHGGGEEKTEKTNEKKKTNEKRRKNCNFREKKQDRKLFGVERKGIHIYI